MVVKSACARAGPFCVKAYDQSSPVLSCGPALDQSGDHIPCGEGAGANAGCTAGQVCPVSPCPPICHTTCSTGCVGL